MTHKNPYIQLNGNVSQLELKPSQWIQLNLRAKYNDKNPPMCYDKHALIEVKIDEKTEEFIITIPKNVKIKYW